MPAPWAVRWECGNRSERNVGGGVARCYVTIASLNAASVGWAGWCKAASGREQSQERKALLFTCNLLEDLAKHHVSDPFSG